LAGLTDSGLGNSLDVFLKLIKEPFRNPKSFGTYGAENRQRVRNQSTPKTFQQ
jgi:hypothetical protein